MIWKLFLDDEREPVDPKFHAGESTWKIARNFSEAVRLLLIEKNCPTFISFDHDLGEDKTGKSFAEYIVNADIVSGGKYIPNDFAFYVHSQNPVGKANIEGYLNDYLNKRKNNFFI